MLPLSAVRHFHATTFFNRYLSLTAFVLQLAFPSFDRS
jgi:hypothetical protein